MAAGWTKLDGSWYYFGQNGKKKTGWLRLRDGVYYLAESGRMAAGCTKRISGRTFRFSSSGRLICGNASSWCLTLVNPSHPLPRGFSIRTADVCGKPFDARAAGCLRAMFAAACEAGIPLQMVSGYRTVEYQRGLMEKSVQRRVDRGMSREAAEAEAALYVAKPGYSEHNLGLAADIVSSDWYCENDDLEAWFDETPHFGWLSENAWKYGFILRYPRDKTDITGIGYEPWHYRYTGVKAARIMHDENITLEEYWEKYLE